MIRKALIFPIKIYQVVMRPLFAGSCVFHAAGSPGCSDYAIAVIAKYGPLKGVWLGFRRVLRCHPWQKNTYDPIP